MIALLKYIWCCIFHWESHRWDFNEHPPQTYCPRCKLRWTEE
jgi:hypothetical protein